MNGIKSPLDGIKPVVRDHRYVSIEEGDDNAFVDIALLECEHEATARAEDTRELIDALNRQIGFFENGDTSMNDLVEAVAREISVAHDDDAVRVSVRRLVPQDAATRLFCALTPEADRATVVFARSGRPETLVGGNVRDAMHDIARIALEGRVDCISRSALKRDAPALMADIIATAEDKAEEHMLTPEAQAYVHPAVLEEYKASLETDSPLWKDICANEDARADNERKAFVERSLAETFSHLVLMDMAWPDGPVDYEYTKPETVTEGLINLMEDNLDVIWVTYLKIIPAD